jgi:HK97 family phage major capsid protein
MSSEVIELLYPMVAVRRLGARRVPLINGNLTMPKVTSGSTAYYIGESDTITPSTIGTGQIKLQEKDLASYVAVTNKLLRNGGVAVDDLIRRDMLQQIASKEDITFIRGTGSANAPKGIYYWAPSANRNAMTMAGASPTLSEVTGDLLKCISLLEQADVRMTSAGWILPPTVKVYLMSLRDGNGNAAFAEEMSKGTLYGIPFATTSQIPINLGVGADETEVYLADFDHVVIADSPEMTIAMDESIRFQQDETVMKIITHHDLGVRQEDAIAVITGVKWTL